MDIVDTVLHLRLTDPQHFGDWICICLQVGRGFGEPMLTGPWEKAKLLSLDVIYGIIHCCQNPIKLNGSSVSNRIWMCWHTSIKY